VKPERALQEEEGRFPAPGGVLVEVATPAPGKKATFGTTSLVFAALTVILPAVMMLIFGQKADRESNAPGNGGYGPLVAIGLLLAGAALGAIAAGLSSLVGTVTGVVALLRGERHTWRPVVGLIVNVPVLLFVAFAAIAIRAGNGG
jgi:hypothetical protein